MIETIKKYIQLILIIISTILSIYFLKSLFLDGNGSDNDAKYAQLQDSLRMEREKLFVKIADLDKINDSLTQQVTVLTKDVEQAKDELSDLSKDKAKVDGEIDRLKADLSKTKGRVLPPDSLINSLRNKQILKY